MSFSYQDGYLHCEGLRVKTIQELVVDSPFYLYSKRQIKGNYTAYSSALDGIPAAISYAAKANGNLHILALFRKLGSWVTLVSGNELRLALAAGFHPKQTIYNGNGKTIAELTLAVEHGSLINIDSDFDLDHIHRVSARSGKPVEVLLRINPNIDPQVHPHVSTGLQNSKFGVAPGDIPAILGRLGGITALHLVGLHCHLGSTIENVAVFQQTMEIMAGYYDQIRAQGFPLQYLNIGGGLGIDYSRTDESFPQPGDLVAALRDRIPAGATLILEPGRSLVGSAGVLVCKVIGVKCNAEKRFIIVDGSMSELIRPSLYQAYHQIGFCEPVDGERQVFDIVGPVCESADFLGKDRLLPTPTEGVGVVVWDAGAYGYAMSSNYNARIRPPEYLVDGDQLKLIRRAENFEDLFRMFG